MQENGHLRNVLQIGQEFYSEVDQQLQQQLQYEESLDTQTEVSQQVQQLVLDRIDEVQMESHKHVPSLDEDEQYLLAFKGQSMAQSIRGSNAAQLKQMLAENSLESELRAVEDDDLNDNDLYGSEDPSDQVDHL